MVNTIKKIINGEVEYNLPGVSTGGASTLTDLEDTSIQTPEQGEVVMFDSTTNKWHNTPLTTLNEGEPTVDGEYVGQMYKDILTDKMYIRNGNEWFFFGLDKKKEIAYNANINNKGTLIDEFSVLSGSSLGTTLKEFNIGNKKIVFAGITNTRDSLFDAYGKNGIFVFNEDGTFTKTSLQSYNNVYTNLLGFYSKASDTDNVYIIGGYDSTPANWHEYVKVNKETLEVTVINTDVNRNDYTEYTAETIDWLFDITSTSTGNGANAHINVLLKIK